MQDHDNPGNFGSRQGAPHGVFKMNTYSEQPEGETRADACESGDELHGAAHGPELRTPPQPPPETIGRRTARAQGLKTYFPGCRCTKGHTSPRRVWDAKCLQCLAEAKAAQVKMLSRHEERMQDAMRTRVLRELLWKARQQARELLRQEKQALREGARAAVAKARTLAKARATREANKAKAEAARAAASASPVQAGPAEDDDAPPWA